MTTNDLKSILDSKSDPITSADSDKEFERVWEAADWMFKNDKQDAKYFFLKGQQVEIVKQQLKELANRHD